MARVVAFLRGINVGGHRVSGAELASIVARLGVEATSYQASGNLVIDGDAELGDASSRADLAARIEATLAEALGYDVPTFVRTAEEVVVVAAERPFGDAEAASKGKPQVMFLADVLPDETAGALLALATASDRLAVSGRQVHWLPAGGVLDAELDLDVVGRLIGSSTMRTRGTVERIAAKFCR